MLERIRKAQTDYPRQFWLLFWGMLISTVGASMIWPFLMIYVSEKLQLPLTSVASLLTLNAAVGLATSFISGPITDRVGRKGVMVLSLLANGVIYIFYSRADTLPEFAILMALAGAVNPIYRIGADAMMADLIPPEKRPEAYALLRMSNNVGVALGPSIGGFIASVSYATAFYIASAGMVTFSLLLAVFAHETLIRSAEKKPEREYLGGYPVILRDRGFLAFVGNFVLTQMCAVLIWTLMAVYAKTNFGLQESQYGPIPTTNAVMVVFLQLYITNWTKRRPTLQMMALGSLFYAVGVGSVALGQGFWGFWVSMVIMTFGELILIPTSTTHVANLAPPDMRGRYMSIYGLTWPIASGIAPLLGGILSDNLAPAATWYGGLVIGSISTIIFIFQYRRWSTMQRAVAGD